MESRAPRVQSHGSGQTTPPDTGAIAVSNHEVRAPRTAWPRRTLGLHLADPCDSIVTQYLTRFAGTMWRRIANMQVTALHQVTRNAVTCMFAIRRHIVPANRVRY